MCSAVSKKLQPRWFNLLILKAFTLPQLLPTTANWLMGLWFFWESLNKLSVIDGCHDGVLKSPVHNVISNNTAFNFCPIVTFTRHSRTERQKKSQKPKGVCMVIISRHDTWYQNLHWENEVKSLLPKAKLILLSFRPDLLVALLSIIYYLKLNTQHDVTILNSWRVSRVSLQPLSTV